MIIFPSIVQGIEKVLTKNGYFMQLAFTYNRVEKEAYILDTMLKNNIDGLIIEHQKWYTIYQYRFLSKNKISRNTMCVYPC